MEQYGYGTGTTPHGAVEERLSFEDHLWTSIPTENPHRAYAAPAGPRRPVDRGLGDLTGFFLLGSVAVLFALALFIPALLLICGWIGRPWLVVHPAETATQAILPGFVVIAFVLAGVLLVCTALRPSVVRLVATAFLGAAGWLGRYVLLPRTATGGHRNELPQISGLWMFTAVLGTLVLVGLAFCIGRWRAPRWIYPSLLAASAFGALAWALRSNDWWTAPAQVTLRSRLDLVGFPLTPATSATVFFGVIGVCALVTAAIAGYRVKHPPLW
jgi:hypothetical protein